VIEGLREAARILREHAIYTRRKGEERPARWAEAEARVMEARVRQEESYQRQIDRKLTEPSGIEICGTCGQPIPR
jgi:hypothetical protein